MVRTTETRHAQWSEFEGLGGPEPLWRIPAERMKMRVEHLVPLPPQAVALLREIKELNVYGKYGNERFGQYLFPVIGNQGDTISSNRMLVLLQRLGVGDKATVHGFRSIASTVLKRDGPVQARLDRTSTGACTRRCSRRLQRRPLSVPPSADARMVGGLSRQGRTGFSGDCHRKGDAGKAQCQGAGVVSVVLVGARRLHPT